MEMMNVKPHKQSEINQQKKKKTKAGRGKNGEEINWVGSKSSDGDPQEREKSEDNVEGGRNKRWKILRTGLSL